MHVENERAFYFGKFVLDRRRGCLQTEGREIDLRPKSFGVLCYLVENAGRLIPKDPTGAAAAQAGYTRFSTTIIQVLPETGARRPRESTG